MPRPGSQQLAGAELEERGLMISGAWLKHSRGKLRLVGRVGEVLGLQAQAAPLDVALAPLARQAAVEQIARIELNSWLSGEDCHRAPASRLEEQRRASQLRGGLIQHPAMIVPFTVSNLLIIGIDLSSDRPQRGEIHRR